MSGAYRCENCGRVTTATDLGDESRCWAAKEHRWVLAWRTGIVKRAARREKPWVVLPSPKDEGSPSGRSVLGEGE